MLPVSLDCHFSLPLRYSLTIFCPVSRCTQCCQFLWIVLFHYPSVFSNIHLSCVLCTLCCQFLWIVLFHYPFGILQHLFVLCLVYQMLPVSLDCPFSLPLRYSLAFICPVSCVTFVASFSLDCHFSLPLRYSLTFICPVSCAPNVASFSGLSFFITPSVFSSIYLSCVMVTIFCQFLWIVFS